jgi:hypothetical protein
MSNFDPEDLKEVPDGTGEDPHPMGPHGNPDQRYFEPLEGDVVLVEGEVMDD